MQQKSGLPENTWGEAQCYIRSEKKLLATKRMRRKDGRKVIIRSLAGSMKSSPVTKKHYFQTQSRNIRKKSKLASPKKQVSAFLNGIID